MYCCWVEEINLIFIVQNYKQRPRNTFEFIVPPSFSYREEIILEEGKNENRAAAAFLNSPFSQVKAR